MSEFAKNNDVVNDSETGVVFGKNAVTELLKSSSPVDTVYISTDVDASLASYYIALSKERRAPVKRIPSVKLDHLCNNPRHQGIAVVTSFCEYVSVKEILDYAKEKNEPPFIVLTDGIEDPHNLGAIIRTAECAGVHGIIIPKRGNVGVNATVHRSSAGACSHLRIARVANLSSTIRELKKTGIFVYCADMDGSDCYRTDLTGPVALVIGSEGFGISRLVKELCDASVSLPLFGEVNSLNASAAASALIYEIVRQKIDKGDINR